MIAVRAAARLLVANANEQQARAYIKHVAGVEVQEVTHDSVDRISFRLPWQEFKTAKAHLDKNLDRAPVTRMAAGYTYYADETRTRLLTIMSGIGFGGAVASVSLYDANHKETHEQMIKRMLRSM